MRAFLLPTLAVVLVVAVCGVSGSPQPAAGRKGASGRPALLDRLNALQLEHGIATRTPEAYYLVVDLAEGRVDLKAGARLLRSAPVLAVDRRIAGPFATRLDTFAQLLPPVTPEPGASDLRLGGQRLPMDFHGRLIEGPRSRSRLWFAGGLLLQPAGMACPEGCTAVGLAGPDIKALGSALRPGAPAILIPNTDNPGDAVK